MQTALLGTYMGHGLSRELKSGPGTSQYYCHESAIGNRFRDHNKLEVRGIINSVDSIDVVNQSH